MKLLLNTLRTNQLVNSICHILYKAAILGSIILIVGSVKAVDCVLNYTSSDIDSTVCPGDQVLFSAQSGYSSYKFYNGTTLVQDNGTNTYLTTGSYDQIYVVVDDASCDVVTSRKIGFTVLPNPFPSLNLAVGDLTMCEGEDVVLDVSPFFSNYDYIINGVSVQSSAISTYATTAMQNNDEVLVKVTDANGCEGVSFSQIFTVKPKATISVAPAQNPICFGEPVDFVADVGFSVYGFYVNGNIVQAAPNNVFTSSSINSGDYIQAVGYDGQCFSDSSDKLYPQVIQLPQGNLISNDPNNNFCEGEGVTIIGSPSGLANYTFYDGANILYSGSSNIYTIPNPTSTSVTFEGEVLGCKTPMSNVLDVNVYDAIDNSAVVSPTDLQLCEGDVFEMKAIPGYLNYQYYVNGVSEQNSNSPDFSSSTLQSNDKVYVEILTADGCLKNSVEYMVNVTPRPEIYLSSLLDSLCAGEVVNLLVSPTAYEGYNYFIDGVSTSTTTEATTELELNPGDYSIHVEGTVGNCLSDPTNSVIIHIRDEVEVAVGNDKTVCFSEDEVQIDAPTPSGGTWSSPVVDASQLLINVSDLQVGDNRFKYSYIDSHGCLGFDEMIVKLFPKTIAEAGPTMVLCNGKTNELQGGGGVSFNWSPSTGLSSSTISNPQVSIQDQEVLYFLDVVDANGCSGRDSVLVKASSLTLDMIGDTTINYGVEIPLRPSGGVTYEVSPNIELSCEGCDNPIVLPYETTTYTIVAIDSNGCTDEKEATISVVLNEEVFVPTAFSPNGDGENDVLYVRGNAIDELEFMVFDRWGNRLFTSTSRDVGWDGLFGGQKAAPGVYMYFLKTTLVNKESLILKGDVTLVR